MRLDRWLLGGWLWIAPFCLPAVQPALPDMGSSAAVTLSVVQEQLLGERYRCQLYGSQRLLTDPLLNHYLSDLGQRLVTHADPLPMPIHFYWLVDPSLNAFAFLGGHIVLHTALLQVTESESELASVIAHEISHVTQRHLARAAEERQRLLPVALAGALGSTLLLPVHPIAGGAALLTTLGSYQQQAISFTQANEQEADRIGIGVLARAGFDVRASVTFLEKLAKSSRGACELPEILLTHPFPQRRLIEARARSEQLTVPQQIQVPQQHLIKAQACAKQPAAPRTIQVPQQRLIKAQTRAEQLAAPRQIQDSLEYYLAKIRWQSLYAPKVPPYQTISPLPSDAALPCHLRPLVSGYHQALLHYRAHQPARARTLLVPLLEQQPENLWLIDLMTDIDVVQQRYCVAAKRLQQALTVRPDHPLLLLNLANVYLRQGSMTQPAIDLLQRYCWRYPQESNGWQLLVTAYAASGRVAEEQAAQAELFMLQGQVKYAIQALHHAIRLHNNPPLIACYQERLRQLQDSR